MLLDIIKNNRLNIELLITRKCNLFCEHCMYDCGPKESADYMSDEVLAKIKKQVEFLSELDLPLIVNIVGGEPTINMSKFEHIFNEIASWNVSVSMSTNGWWLRSKEATKRFLKIVSKFAPRDGNANNKWGKKAYIIRISDDPYHQKQRVIKDIDVALDNIFDDIELINECNSPLPDITDPWIFRQKWDAGFYYVAPNGRGKSVTNFDEWMTYFPYYQKTGNYCSRDLIWEPPSLESVHYEPDGLVSDACGLGSWYDFGTVDDNILFIIELIRQYKLDRYYSGKKYTCKNCREMVQSWKLENLEKYRKQYSLLNTFDVEKFSRFANDLS
jgi:hypothetical protein